MRIQDLAIAIGFPKEQRAACYTAGLYEQDIIRLRTTTNQTFAPPIRDHWVFAPEHMTPADVITLPIGAGAQVLFDTQESVTMPLVSQKGTNYAVNSAFRPLNGIAGN